MSRKRWVYSHADGHLVAEYHDGVCVFIDESYYTPTQAAPDVMPDIQPYQSMIDGSTITSRSRHREHLRDHNCVEVGNDSSLFQPPKPRQAPPGLKEKIIRAVNHQEEIDRRKKWH